MSNVNLMESSIRIKTAFFLFVFISILCSFAEAKTGGDAVYREGGFANNLDHAGVYNTDGQVYEIRGYWYQGGDGVELSSWTRFLDSQTYLGAFWVPGMSSSDRDDILDICDELDNDPEITYTLFAALYYESNPGTWIDVDEITDIRCDGVVEYAYEWNLIEIWGKANPPTSSGTPTNFDISYPAYCDEHANLGGDQPWIELSPKVQRGSSGTDWTKLRPSGDDNYEENDTISTAYNLSSNEQTWLTTIDGPGIQADDDWYEIYISSGYENVIINCQFLHADGDIDIELYDSSETFLTLSQSTSDDEYIDYIVAGSGTYYIKIHYGNAGNSYNLWWDDIQATGSLQVNITPQGAVDAGAQWRVDGGVWKNSGDTVSGLSVGDHLVEFEAVTGWNEPADYTVPISDGVTTILTAPYSAESGSLQVNITPQGAIDAGAQWKVDSGAWQNSGVTISGLSVGDHLVEFKTISSWYEPGDLTTQIYNNQTTIVNETYTQVIEWIISGRVHTAGGTGISDVTMNGWPGTVPVTDSNGYYSGIVPNGWSGTITPSKDNYNFSPLSYTYSSVTSNQLNQDYTGALITSEEFFEDFETGDYSSNPWYYFGTVPWDIISDEVHEGNYGVRSGTISDGQYTGIGVSKTLSAGYITFWRKVSSEELYDKLIFYIDGSPVGVCSGEKDWARKSYFIDEGTHTFDWMYQKDSSISDGNDCGWIDDIIFEPEPVDPALHCWIDFHSYSKFENNMTVTDSNNFTYNMTYEDSWLIGVPAGDFTVTFESLAVDDMELVVRHLSSAYAGCQGGGYSPVTISLNGVPIVSDYDPAENHGGSHGFATDVWPISVNAGTNTLEWTANNLCTNYWIQGVEIRYPIELEGDFDYDSIVDSNDIKMLVDYWLEDCSTPNWCGGRDIDKSDSVNFVDFCRFAENWLKEN